MKHFVAAAVLTFGASTAHADIEQITLETLVHAQSLESLSLSIIAPPGADSELKYLFSANTNNGSFAWQAAAGQTYNGLSYSMSGQGSFDALTQTFTWSASGLLGAEHWEHTGQAQWVGDPTASITGNVSIGGKPKGMFSGTVDIDSLGHSSGTGSFTPAGGSPGSGYEVTDFVRRDLPWTITWHGHPAELEITHSEWLSFHNDDGMFLGTSTTNIVAVPEPATWIMMYAGIAVLLGCRNAGKRMPPLGFPMSTDAFDGAERET